MCKRLWCTLIACAMLFCLLSCAKEEEATTEPAPPPEPTQAESREDELIKSITDEESHGKVHIKIHSGRLSNAAGQTLTVEGNELVGDLPRYQIKWEYGDPFVVNAVADPDPGFDFWIDFSESYTFHGTGDSYFEEWVYGPTTNVGQKLCTSFTVEDTVTVTKDAIILSAIDAEHNFVGKDEYYKRKIIRTETSQTSYSTYTTTPQEEPIPENKVYIYFEGQHGSVTNATGETIKADGEQLVGNMKIYRCDAYIADDGPPTYEIWIDPSESYTFKNTKDTIFEDRSRDRTDEKFRLVFIAQDTVTVTEDSITLSAADAEQKYFSGMDEYRGRAIVRE